MLSREVMKAAEYASSDMKFDRVPRCRDVQVCTDHILAHREDYAEDGTPLEVDEGFCRELGMTRVVTQYNSYHELYVGLSEGRLRIRMDDNGELCVDGVVLSRKATRPQLRALIQCLRGSQE